jgi:hypothetical protein
MKPNTPTIPVAWGELVDKITILEIKKTKINDESKLLNIATELALLRQPCHEDVIGAPTMAPLINALTEINLKLWEIEDLIRIKEKNQDFDNQFIELARSVYFQNDERAKIKRRINEKTDSEIFEEKSYVKY